MPQSSSPQPFWHEGPVSWKTVFPRTGVGGWFQVIQAHYPYCALYFYYYYYISFSSDDQALDPGRWELLPYRPCRPTCSWLSALILASWQLPNFQHIPVSFSKTNKQQQKKKKQNHKLLIPCPHAVTAFFILEGSCLYPIAPLSNLELNSTILSNWHLSSSFHKNSFW